MMSNEEYEPKLVKFVLKQQLGPWLLFSEVPSWQECLIEPTLVFNLGTMDDPTCESRKVIEDEF